MDLHPFIEEVSQESKNFWQAPNTRELGSRSEKLVQAVFEKNGFLTIKKNFRTPYAEVDFIFEKEATQVLVEVKFRETLKNRSFLDSLGWNQRQRLKRAALWVYQTRPKHIRRVRAGLCVVQKCNIRWVNLPLLYDTA